MRINLSGGGGLSITARLERGAGCSVTVTPVICTQMHRYCGEYWYYRYSLGTLCHRKYEYGTSTAVLCGVTVR